MPSYTPNQTPYQPQHQPPAQPGAQPPYPYSNNQPYGYGQQPGQQSGQQPYVQPGQGQQPYQYSVRPYNAQQAGLQAPARKGLPIWAIIGGVIVVLGLLVGLLAATGVLKGSITVSSGGMHVAGVTLAKGYDNDSAVNPTTTFRPIDNPIHAVVTIENATAGSRVTGVWSLVDAGGEQNLEIGRKELSLEAGNTYTAHYTAELTQDWPMGKYKFEVYLNDKLEKTVEFTVQ